MKLTKYVHSCLVLEEQGKKVIIDPGSWATEFGDAANVVAVVVTHVHADHFSAENLEAIFAQNPDAKLFTTEEVKQQFDKPSVVTPQAGEKVTIGPFTLEFFGGLHAEIHAIKPVAQNIGVMLNDVLYYPGDALTPPGKPVKVLSMPSAAPWMKMSEAIQYLQEVKPSEFFFPTHNALLSDKGHQAYETVWLNNAAEALGLKQTILEPGDAVEI